MVRKTGYFPGRWAVNYSFLYILIRILTDCKPQKIIEFGLGESSKIISVFCDNYLTDSTQLIIEQDQKWITAFQDRFVLSSNSKILQLELEEKKIKNFPVYTYKGLNEIVEEVFDLYIVDGPFGSDRFSRYDICLLVDKLNVKNDFIIIIDDYNRQGEKDTAIDILNQLEQKGIKTFCETYSGNKSQLVITTEKFKFITSL